MYRRFLSYYKPYWHLFIMDMVCVLIAAAADLAFPQILRYMTGKVFLLPGNEIIPILVRVTAALFVMYLVRYAAMYMIGAWGHIMGARMETDMRRSIFRQYQKLSFSYYDKNNTGDMLSRIVTDLFDIAELAHHGPETLLLAAIKIAGSFVLLLMLNVPLTLILFAVTLLMALLTYIQNRKLSRIFAENRKKISDINTRVVDSLSGIRVVKSFSNETLENSKFDQRNNSLLATKEMSYRALGFMHSGNALCQGILYIIILAVGGLYVAQGKLAASELAIYALYVGIFLHPVDMLLHFSESFQRGMSGFKRFDELMKTTPEITDAPDAVELEKVTGKVSFRDVTFGYAKDKEVLHNIDLDLEPGKTVALVGVSGGGKSTICSLLMRFYDIWSGSVTIDGTDIRKIKQSDLRKHIGIVQQDLYMFNGTVRENILYGKQDASDEEMIEAAKRASIHDFIMTLPNGYDTEVGERGVRLSGGQKQRLSIARVFLKDPEILILDEATSALDNESERKIQKVLGELSSGRTTLVIAHRLSTVRRADEIVVISDGKAVERGTHEELSAKDGIYSRLSHI